MAESSSLKLYPWISVPRGAPRSGMYESLLWGFPRARAAQGPSKEMQFIPIPKEAPIPLLGVSIAASVESFWRSPLNAYINRRLLGEALAEKWPNMFSQVSARILYVNGLKFVRAYVDKHVDPTDYEAETAVRVATWCAPGVIMTPISSVLEAANAGHKNPESLWTKRWQRGISARVVREVIFAIGMNQMSDTFIEAIPNTVIPDDHLRTAVGSLASGVFAGYLSQIPHNLSAFKLFTPSIGYKQHLENLVKRRMELGWIGKMFGGSIPKAGPMRALAYTSFIIAPPSVGVRTIQIMGTFAIINTIIHLWQMQGLDY